MHAFAFVAAKPVVIDTMVGKWRRRFCPGPFRWSGGAKERGPRTIDDAHIEATIVLTLESLPKDATHCSSRGMAKESG